MRRPVRGVVTEQGPAWAAAVGIAAVQYDGSSSSSSGIGVRAARHLAD